MPVNNITTPRVLVSPRAVTVAAWLNTLNYREDRPLGLFVTSFRDAYDAQLLGLSPVSLSRAYRELERLGAVELEAPAGGCPGYVRPNLGHWVFAAAFAVTTAGKEVV